MIRNCNYDKFPPGINFNPFIHNDHTQTETIVLNVIASLSREELHVDLAK